MTTNNYFIKKAKSESLLAEEKGLELLRSYSDIHSLQVPNVITRSNDEMVLGKINSVNPTKDHFLKLAQGLAKLHQIPQKQFGLDYNNFIGLNPQKNVLSNNWGDFFYHYRLYTQANMIKNHELRTEYTNLLKQKEKSIISFLNDHNPTSSLVHGDLWNGNVMYAKEGVYLIDPAVYFGDPEVDLAMMRLFGGFSEEVFHHYDDFVPPKKNREQRRILYNLYHELNHFNLFGDSYLPQVQKGFRFIEDL